MGVRGLTTFINANAHSFFIQYKLQECTLIIDGNSLAAVLYSETLGAFSSFGGDYDLFAAHVENFIKNLKMCKVVPVVIFDGGYEARKANTVRKRNKMKVFAIDKVTPDRPAREFYPLLMRSVLQERLIELGVICLQSDYEADGEIAAISKRLNAPVLSNDSDFFIYDVPYLPLAYFSFDIQHNLTKSGTTYHYLSCQIFCVDKFLKTFGGLEKNMLPLLATLLGNDYLNRSTFKNFFGLIKMDKGKKLTLGQRRIGGLVKWLKKESFDSALKKILTSLPKKRRGQVKCRINSIVKGYSNLEICLLNCLPEIISVNLNDENNLSTQLTELSIGEENNEHESDCEEVLEEEDDDISENSQVEDNESEEIEDEEIELEDSESEIPQWLLERSRKCQIAPQVMTLLTLNTYFFVPQMEDCSRPYAGEIGLPILRTIATLCLGASTIVYCHRLGSNAYRAERIEVDYTFKHGKLPDISTLNKVSCKERKDILLDTLKMENELYLNSIPEDWHLLFICLVYWLKSDQTLKPYHIHAVIIMVIAVNVFHSKLGYFRKKKSFIKKYGAKVKSLEKIRECNVAKFLEDRKGTVVQELAEVTTDDCLVTFENILPYFSVDISLKDRPRTFQRSIIHCFAELQTVMDLAQVLNSLLLQPYRRIQVSKFYNGTFLYNLAVLFKRQTDIISFLEKFLKKSPNLLNLHMSFYNELYKFSGIINVIPRIPNVKKRRRRKKKLDTNNVDKEVISEDSEDFLDENNKFSLLQETKQIV